MTPGNEWPVRWSSGSSKENKKREFGEAFLFFSSSFSSGEKKREKKAQKVNVWTPLCIRPTICPLDGMDTYRVCEDFDALGCWLTALTRQSPREKQICTTGVSFFYLFLFFLRWCVLHVQLVLLLLSFLFFRLSTAECDTILKEITISPCHEKSLSYCTALSDGKCVILFLYTLIFYIPSLSFVHYLVRCVTITTSNQFWK